MKGNTRSVMWRYLVSFSLLSLSIFFIFSRDVLFGEPITQKSTVLELCDRLLNGSPDQRRIAAAELVYLGREAEKAIPALIVALDDSDIKTASLAAASLDSLEVRAESAISKLGLKFRRRDEFDYMRGGPTSNPYSNALAKIGLSAVGELRKSLMMKDPETIHDATAALGYISVDAKSAVPDLIKLVDQPDRDCQIDNNEQLFACFQCSGPFNSTDEAIFCLGLIGSGASSAAPAIRKYLLESNEIFSEYPAEKAVLSLTRIGDAPIDLLLKAIQSNDGPMISILSIMGESGRPAIPALRSKLEEPNDGMQYYAAIALLRIAPNDGAIVDKVIDHLLDESVTIDSRIVTALGRVGNRAIRALPLLIHNLSREEMTDWTLFESISKIDPEGSMSLHALMTFLDSKCECHSGRADGYCEDTIRAIGRIGPKAGGSVRSIIKYLHSEDDGVQRLAIIALGRIGVASIEAVPELVKLIPKFPEDVANALGAIGLGSSDAVEPMIKYLNRTELFEPELIYAVLKIDPNRKFEVERILIDRKERLINFPLNRCLIEAALGRRTPLLEIWLRDELDCLKHYLNEEEFYDQGMFSEQFEDRLEEIGRVGTLAEIALPNLVALSKHRNALIRRWALETIGKVSTEKSKPK